jgi:hypothetical protein
MTADELIISCFCALNKAKLFRYRHAGSMWWGRLILDLGTRWGWVVSITPRPPFSPVERTPGTKWTGGWVDPRAGLDTEVRGQILLPLPGIEPWSPGRPVRSQTLYCLSYSVPPFISYVLPKISSRWSNKGGWDGRQCRTRTREKKYKVLS